MEKTYSISELADAAGVTPRTIRFYTTEGLIPAPDTSGRVARYNEDHLNRLRVIQQLKAAFLPLNAIRDVMGHETSESLAQKLEIVANYDNLTDSTSPEDVSVLANRVNESAADYIRRISQPVPPSPAVSSETPATRMSHALNLQNSLRRFARKPSVPATEQWERIILSSDVELHARNPRTPEAQRLIERLMESIRRNPMKEDK